MSVSGARSQVDYHWLKSRKLEETAHLALSKGQKLHLPGFLKLTKYSALAYLIISLT